MKKIPEELALERYLAGLDKNKARCSDNHILALNTPEAKEKMRANGSKPKGKEHAEKNRVANLGKKKSNETKQKISEAQIGNQKHAKPVHCGNLGDFSSLKIAGEAAMIAGLRKCPVQASKALRQLMKTDPNNYYFIEK